MKIAVTGGNGRVGRAVIEMALEEGHTVVSLDRVFESASASDARVTQIECDTSQYDPFLAAIDGCEALIHLAAIPSPTRHPDHIVHNNNVTSSYNALRAAAECGIMRICQASSINAIGGAYSRWPTYDYFPLDEKHPTYAEDPYSLSKWICEIQADSMVRRYEGMKIASLRLHGVVNSVEDTSRWKDSVHEILAKHLWGYTTKEATARACLLGITADFDGHEAFYIVAPYTMMDTPSVALRDKHFPEVPITGDLSGTLGFFNCQKAEQLLGWKHSLD